MQKLDLLTREAELIQDKLARDAIKAQNTMSNRMATAGDMQVATQKVLGMQQDDVARHLEVLRRQAQKRAGNLQDLIGEVMEARAEKKFADWGLVR